MKTSKKGAPARPHGLSEPLSAHRLTATALLGASLVAYRVNNRPHQRAELLGMARMAAALGALPPAELQAMQATLASVEAREVRHG